MKNPHPSGRPIRREIKKGRAYWNYPADPAVVYAVPRLRPKSPLPVADCIGYKTVDIAQDDGCEPVGFIRFRAGKI